MEIQLEPLEGERCLLQPCTDCWHCCLPDNPGMFSRNVYIKGHFLFMFKMPFENILQLSDPAKQKRSGLSTSI